MRKSWHDGGSNVTINGYNGNDYIEISSHYDSDDETWHFGRNISVNGGAGNDTIVNAGENVTII